MALGLQAVAMRLREMTLWPAVGVLALVVGCTCGDKNTVGTDGMRATTDAPALSLSPLPAVPTLDVARESLPGADGALAVVAARPQGVIEGEVRPTVTFSKPVKSLEMVEAQRGGD
ncbi:MAG: hypothetical protein JNG84_05235, partial [Archangium sp.]|nr:hypothetical protein [Archangium sp.]